MATAESAGASSAGAGPSVDGGRTRRARWPLALVVGAVAIAAVAGAAVARGRGDEASDGRADEAAVAEPAAVAVASDAPRHADLASLVAAADAVVVGEVTATEPGRWFGDDVAGRLRSRLVTLSVDEVVAGEGPEAASVLVEEEGWSADGAPLVVDGAAPSAVGDRGVWFLVETGDAETGAWITVGSQGRYLVDPDDVDGPLVGAEFDDPLVADLSAETLERLVSRIRATVVAS